MVAREEAGDGARVVDGGGCGCGGGGGGGGRVWCNRIVSD